ncbi:hypothetical protein KJ570_02700 [Patescibacteria group bacterium]|nr:hypothetical protein [Patescibacteria group bacterium]MBU2036528.1 hypothetical protein [Patescibacteria group bacterium]
MPDIQQNPVNVPQPQAPQMPKPIVKPVFKKDLKKNLLLIGGIVLLVLAGTLTGWFLSGKKSNLGSPQEGSIVAPGAKSGTEEAGLADEATFRDSAEGLLEEGGVNGEGTHHLVREGGISQTVYLTSTVIDLESFTGKKVKVWGETITAKKAGWLMDVGKIRVIE